MMMQIDTPALGGRFVDELSVQPARRPGRSSTRRRDGPEHLSTRDFPATKFLVRHMDCPACRLRISSNITSWYLTCPAFGCAPPSSIPKQPLPTASPHNSTSVVTDSP